MFDDGNERFDTRSLMRLATWGTGAAFALALVVATGFSAYGSKRAATAVAALTGAQEAPGQVTAAQLIPRPSDNDAETRRLNEAVRLLAADRDRLLTRVGSLERNLDNMTGSVNGQAGNTRSSPLPPTSSLQPEPAAPVPHIEKPRTTTATAPVAPPPPAGPAVPDWINSGITTWAPPPPANMPAAPPQRTASVPTETAAANDTRPPGASRTEFGVDLGSAATLEAAKEIWAAVKAQQGPLVGKLQPVVSERPNRAGVVETRVIIGPFSNASAAAKLCATLGARDVMCSATTYSGDRLR